MKLTADPITSGIPVGFLSGHTSEEKKSKRLSSGARAFLSRPIDPVAVNTLVADALGPVN